MKKDPLGRESSVLILTQCSKCFQVLKVDKYVCKEWRDCYVETSLGSTGVALILLKVYSRSGVDPMCSSP